MGARKAGVEALEAGTAIASDRKDNRVLLAQYVSTDRDPRLFLSEVAPASGAFSGSLLLAYKLNRQSVMFAGYGDDRALSDQDRLESSIGSSSSKFPTPFRDDLLVNS